MKFKNQIFSIICISTLLTSGVFANSIEPIKTLEAAKPTYPVFIQLNKYVKTEKEYLRRLKDAFEKGYELFAYKDNKGHILGIMGLSYPQELYWDKYMHIDTLVVDAKHRRKGIAKKLMEKAKEIADSKKITKLSWETGATSNDAQAFYKALGHKITAHEYRYYPKK